MGKNPLQSMTIRGLLVVVFGALVNTYGLPIEPEVLSQEVIDIGGHILEIVGIAVATFGRWRASEPLRM